jgi:signal transduction histidine kinase
MSEEIIVKHMDGTIEVENVEFDYNKEKQKGTKFTITLPLSN